MGVLSLLEARFEENRASFKFHESWEQLKSRQPALGPFGDPAELRDFCQDASVGYDQQDPLVLALCVEARAEAGGKSSHRLATNLLIWIFLPALWKVAEQAGAREILTLDEIEQEILSGFWEEAVSEQVTSEKLSGRLVNAGRHQLWRAIRTRLKDAHPGLEAAEEIQATDTLDPEWADPWMLLCWARLEGKLTETEAELIFWTQLHDERLDEVSALLGLTYEAGRIRRKRAAWKIAGWVGELADGYPPKDPELACRVRKLAQEPSRLAPFLGRLSDPKQAPDVLGG